MPDRIIITGASGGLGSIVTQTFRDAGAAVATLDRSSGADLSTSSGATAAVNTAAAKLGGVDALIHLVGGFAAAGSLTETPDDVWEKMWTLNFRAALYAMRATLPLMRAAGHGRIVAIGSRAGLEPPPGLGAYAVSKAALHALVKAAAAEAGPGITVNAVLPGTIDTPANRAALPDADPAKWVTPAAVASLLQWLVSPAGGAMNGALLPVDGGA